MSDLATKAADDLAQRHQTADADQAEALANYGERPRAGDWSMRAALTRYAQPEALRAARVLMLVRRLDAALHALRKIERRAVICDRQLVAEALASPAIEPYPDTRVADLARVLHQQPDLRSSFLPKYEEATTPLDTDETQALPLLGVALLLEDLAQVLAEWANAGPENPPNDTLDAACDSIQTTMDELGVPVEQAPPGRGRPRR